ncbi:MAG: hypothetical protein CSA94_01385 [Bacteroidetes bacterium]|nr:MAG: hypothetical protein CSA94_01385 [Bacteroidota bacterium]
MKKFMILLAAVSCSDDDDKVVPKDYGMKVFSADLMYQPAGGGGMSTDFSCKQQVYFKLGQENAVAVGNYTTKDNWTTFDLLPKIPSKMTKQGGIPDTKNPNYNVTTTQKGWDLLFTQYIDDAYAGHGPKGMIMPYYLAGVLCNTADVKIALYKYEGDENIAKAFADLKLANVKDVMYSNKINAIGTSFRSMKGMPPVFAVNANHFYIIKTAANETYKLRFTEYSRKKVISVEYALMK